MKKFILAILGYILTFQENAHTKRQKEILAANENSAKSILTPHVKLEIENQILDENKAKIEKTLTPIIKENLENQDKILDFIKDEGTLVYKIKNADKILTIIGEKEGFITPIKGLKAIYLNLSLKRPPSTRTNEMFVLKNSKISTYTLAYNLYRWYSFKLNIKGYDSKTQENFKKIWLFEKEENVKKLNYNELSNLKEAIKRDREAIDFAINLAKEIEGTKKGFDNLQNGGAAI